MGSLLDLALDLSQRCEALSCQAKADQPSCELLGYYMDVLLVCTHMIFRGLFCTQLPKSIGAHCVTNHIGHTLSTLSHEITLWRNYVVCTFFCVVFCTKVPNSMEHSAIELMYW